MLALGEICTKFKKSLHEFNPLFFFYVTTLFRNNTKSSTVTKSFCYEIVENKFLKSKQVFQRDDNSPWIPTQKKRRVAQMHQTISRQVNITLLRLTGRHLIPFPHSQRVYGKTEYAEVTEPKFPDGSFTKLISYGAPLSRARSSAR